MRNLSSSRMNSEGRSPLRTHDGQWYCRWAQVAVPNGGLADITKEIEKETMSMRIAQTSAIAIAVALVDCV